MKFMKSWLRVFVVRFEDVTGILFWNEIGNLEKTNLSTSEYLRDQSGGSISRSVVVTSYMAKTEFGTHLSPLPPWPVHFPSKQR